MVEFAGSMNSVQAVVVTEVSPVVDVQLDAPAANESSTSDNPWRSPPGHGAVSSPSYRRAGRYVARVFARVGQLDEFDTEKGGE